MTMIESPTLLQAVVADPDNDAPRLAYADWLDAEGDTDRAAFIRLQCALERLPDDDAQLPALRQREAELLGQYGYRWAEPFGDQIHAWGYRRGFIERVEMRLEAPADQIRAVLRRAPIRHIRDVSQLDDFGGVVAVLPELAGLTGLEFWGLYAFDDRLLGRILAAPELASLQTLILHHDRNGNLAKETVLAEALFSPLRANLRELAINVDGTWRGPSPRLVQAMARSPFLANLRTLDLSHARLGAATVEAIGRSASLAGLTALDLSGCSLTEAAWRAVLKLPQLPRLRWLRLANARLVDGARRHRGDLRDMPEYVDAFAALVATVDWDTAYRGPHSGGSWAGLSWAARRRNRLFAMSDFLHNQDYDGLEAEYRRECLLNGGPAVTKAIDSLPFAAYGQGLTAALDTALAQREGSNAQALVLRIRPDAGWTGALHLQANPAPDTWEPYEEYSYSNPALAYPVPGFPGAAAIFAEHPLNSSIHPSGAALYLIARTLAAFGRCLDARSLPIPAWLSCGWAAFRLK